MNRKIVLFSFFLAAAACGGGEIEATTITTVEATSVTSVGVAEPTVALDFDIPEAETTNTTAATDDSLSLFEGFTPEEVDQSDIAIDNDSPNVEKVADEIVFTVNAPGECKNVPIDAAIATKQVIFDLHWSCFYRPKVITDDNDWLRGIAAERYDRSELREKVADETRESDCFKGGSCEGVTIALDLGENVRVVCDFDSVAVPNERAQTRLQSVCGDTVEITMGS